MFMCVLNPFLTDDPIVNERYLMLRFKVPESSTVHGFAGYFDTELYDNITLSTCVCILYWRCLFNLLCEIYSALAAVIYILLCRYHHRAC